MNEGGSTLQQARRRVQEAEERVTEQRQRVAELRRGGHDIQNAEELLALFERSLAALRGQLAKDEQHARK
jgi:Fe2+ or Zn2+ uptake regulation protein